MAIMAVMAWLHMAMNMACMQRTDYIKKARAKTS